MSMKVRNAVLAGSKVAGVLGCLLLLGAPTCAKLGDGLVSPSADRIAGDASECVRGCVDVAQALRDAEQELHQQNVRDCHDPVCAHKENRRHQLVMASIAQEEQACKRNCHSQGGGGGGQ